MFGFFILRKCLTFHAIRPCAAYFKTTLCVILAECGHFVVTWSVQKYSCGHIGFNKTKHRYRLGISSLNSLLTVQFNVPQKCYEFKLSTELLNAMNTMLFLRNCCLDFVWIFCCQKIWITQASNLEITKKIMATLT